MPAAQTDPAIISIITTAIDAAVRSAIDAATAEGEQVVAHRVTQHNYGHIIIWLDCKAGKFARLVVWDGSTLVAPLSISGVVRTRTKLRALEVHGSAALVQDWTEL